MWRSKPKDEYAFPGYSLNNNPIIRKNLKFLANTYENTAANLPNPPLGRCCCSTSTFTGHCIANYEKIQCPLTIPCLARAMIAWNLQHPNGFKSTSNAVGILDLKAQQNLPYCYLVLIENLEQEITDRSPDFLESLRKKYPDFWAGDKTGTNAKTSCIILETECLFCVNH